MTEIEATIKSLLKGCKVERIDYEGVGIGVYVKDICKFYDDPTIIKSIASSLKKKVSIKVSPEYLMPKEEAKKKIKSIVPEEAGITEILFLEPLSEVKIIAMKPGLVIGKGGSLLREILMQTGWSPSVLREPTLPSSTINSLRKAEVAEADERKRFLLNIGKSINRVAKPNDYLRIITLGAFREVGRSCIVVETNNSRVMVDCGVSPSELEEPQKSYPYLNKMGFGLDDLDAVVISHGHMDHMGFLPYLLELDYAGPIYMTPPTKDLAALLQPDYINVVKSNGFEPPYSKKAIQKELKQTITVDYNAVVDITPDIKLTFYNAGHIIGSAMVHLHIGGGVHNMVYSGDIKFGPTQLFDPAVTQFPRAETFFIESTYGGKDDILPGRKEREEGLIAVIKKTIERKGKVLIPVFAVGRAQEIMLVLEDYASNNPDFNVPIFIDGMVLEASAIHTAYPDYLKGSLKKRILGGSSPFEYQGIKVANGKSREEIVEGEPAIILAPSGMLSGGPSVEYLKMMAEDKRNTLIFVGYQSRGSLGSKIQQGERKIMLMGADGRTKELAINMEVVTVEGFSGHSDIRQLIAFLRSIRPTPSTIYTMHGEESKTVDFARTISRVIGRNASSPYNMEIRRLR
ncbi:MAG: beta-CASP ribonuclease aCPSF1 [Candidatus Anstonellales archaeon]